MKSSKNSGVFKKTTSALWSKAASYNGHEQKQNGGGSTVTPVGRRRQVGKK